MTILTNNYYVSVCCYIVAFGTFINFFLYERLTHSCTLVLLWAPAKPANECVCVWEKKEGVRVCACAVLLRQIILWLYSVWLAFMCCSIAILQTQHAEIINGMNWWLLAVETTPMRERLFRYLFHSLSLSSLFFQTLFFSR